MPLKSSKTKKNQVDPESQSPVEQFKDDHAFKEFEEDNEFEDDHTFEEFEEDKEFQRKLHFR